MSAPHRAWLAAGQPPHPYARTAATGPCATCAAPLDDGAVALSEIETPTMLDAYAGLMDDDICEALHREMAPCTPEAYLAAYAERVGPDAAGIVVLGS